MTSRQVAASPAYLDTCVVLSLFLADHGYSAAEQWLRNQRSSPILVSHWLLVEFAGVVALCRRRIRMLSPRTPSTRGTRRQRFPPSPGVVAGQQPVRLKQPLPACSAS